MSAKDIWKSETMIYCEMSLRKDYAFATLENLLDHKAVHFLDQNPEVEAFQRPYIANIVKIADLESKLTNLRHQIEHSEIKIPTSNNIKETSLLQLETVLEKSLAELSELRESLQASVEVEQSLEEEIEVYKSNIHLRDVVEGNMLGSDVTSDELINIVFSVAKKVLTPCLRGLFKSTYGFLEYETQDFINDKELISIFLTGKESESKCARIIQSLGGKIYNLTQDSLSEAENKLSQVQQSVSASNQRINQLLMSKSSYMDGWTALLDTHKSVNHALNLFSVQEYSETLKCRCYVPETMFQIVRMSIEGTNSRQPIMGNSLRIVENAELTDIERNQQPPTLFKRNKYTSVFQNIVNSYGVPSYKEINPAFFYLYQFPFTFSVMFGDIGHGIINMLISLMMLIFEKKLQQIHNDMFELIFMGRYIIFMMSCFSIVAGFIYNDCFALGFNFFNSRYNIYDPGEHRADSPVYGFGIDPVWHWAGNSMIFLNSYKMKLSVIIGIAEMLFGLVVNLINFISQKKYKLILLTWVPEFCFMLSFFGYMVFCIIYKFFVNWPGTPDRTQDSPSDIDPAPPALINMLIQIFLSPGSVDPQNQLFSNLKLQEQVQLIVFFVAIIMVVWLACAEPIYEIIHLKKHPNPNVEVGDIVVEQVIHTIEYVLGCISHTASYLRLWALSLAHAQLAEVFFEQLLGISMGFVKENNLPSYILAGVSMLVTYGGFFGASIGVLCLMEYLSAFLHCLRLAWIEFNSKFFAAEGYEFEGFSLPETLPLEVSAEIARSE